MLLRLNKFIFSVVCAIQKQWETVKKKKKKAAMHGCTVANCAGWQISTTRNVSQSADNILSQLLSVNVECLALLQVHLGLRYVSASLLWYLSNDNNYNTGRE